MRAKHARAALVLFKPFRSVNDLVDGDIWNDNDWNCAYETWEIHRSSFITTIMANMGDYFKGRGERHNQDFALNEDEANELTDASESNNGCDGWVDCFNTNEAILEDEPSELDDYELCESSLMNPILCPSTSIPDDHVNAILKNFDDLDLLAPRASETAK
ncbi:hypothetical protein PF004_g19886 [Phytophthora fragariae]|uniref:Uncharacterized protein n=1 Tax=Phytophthora fragariae TaxID=53985 RepID=A0A6G0N953_9STRA|nr:hypothetical protein PF004_g19886 [Phytophthora fragariae]